MLGPQRINKNPWTGVGAASIVMMKLLITAVLACLASRGAAARPPVEVAPLPGQPPLPEGCNVQNGRRCRLPDGSMHPAVLAALSAKASAVGNESPPGQLAPHDGTLMAFVQAALAPVLHGSKHAASPYDHTTVARIPHTDAASAAAAAAAAAATAAALAKSGVEYSSGGGDDSSSSTTTSSTSGGAGGGGGAPVPAEALPAWLDGVHAASGSASGSAAHRRHGEEIPLELLALAKGERAALFASSSSSSSSSSSTAPPQLPPSTPPRPPPAPPAPSGKRSRPPPPPLVEKDPMAHAEMPCNLVSVQIHPPPSGPLPLHARKVNEESGSFKRAPSPVGFPSQTYAS